MARIVLRPIAVEQANSDQQFGPMYGPPGVGIASEPTGSPSPFLTAITPATNVVDTAPIPGMRTPSLPFAGDIF